MAKNVAGEVQVVTANRLRDGVVVYLAANGQWTTDIGAAALARDAQAASLLLSIGAVAAAESRVIEPYLAAVVEEGGSVVPVTLRERIRATGLTMDVIAAEALSYA